MDRNRKKGSSGRVILIVGLLVGGGMLAWLKYESGAPARANNEAVGLLNQGRAADALIVLDNALRNHGDNAMLHYNRGVALVELERCEEAIPALEQAIRLDNSIAPQANEAMAECQPQPTVVLP